MISDYALLDCGHGRRLERFGGLVVDRPAPAAEWAPGLSEDLWAGADLRFYRGEGEGEDEVAGLSADGAGSAIDVDGGGNATNKPRAASSADGWRGTAPEDWRVLPPIAGWPKNAELGLRPAAGGQIGVFPEQWPLAVELARTLARARARDIGRERIVLNVFAHTGAASVAALSVDGVRLVHLDASRGAVARARENARRAGLADRPAHWVVDDALAFLRREAKRGRRYDALLFDPPAFGRGPKSSGRSGWRFERDLPELLDLAQTLTAPDAVFSALIWHATGGDDALARRLARVAIDRRGGGDFSVRDLILPAEAKGRPLPAGRVACWKASSA